MTPIESQETLKTALTELQSQGYVQSNGPLDRRGVEVDHTFYLVGENQKLTPGNFSASEPETRSVVDSRPSAAMTGRDDLREQQATMAAEIATLTAKVAQLAEQMEEFRRAVGM